MKRVLIAGYYGFGNTGDEAILAAMLADLRALEPALLATVAAEDTRATSAHGVATVHWRDVPGIAAAVQEADLVILGGGGLFQDSLAFDPGAILTPRHHGISYYAGYPLLAAALGKPCAMYAVGVGPLTTAAGRSGTRAAFERADLVTVRDAASKATLVALGIDADRIHVTADPAFRLPRASDARAEEILRAAGLDTRARPRVGVALRHWEIGVDPASWEEQVALALDAFLERHDGAAVFVPFQALRDDLVNDVAVAQRVRARLRHATRTVVLDGSPSPAEKAAVLASCDLVLGMRLHSIVFAVSAGVAAVALAYDPKVRAAMAEAGAPERVIDLAGVTAAPLLALLSDTCTQRAEVGQRLGSSAGRLREAAAETARLALRSTPGPSLGAQLRALSASPRWVLHHRLRVAVAPPGTSRERLWRRIQGRRGSLAERIAASRGAVIFPPSIGWKVDLVQRPHHLARAFARAGYVAVFDSTHSHDGVEGFQEIEPGVFLYGGPHEVLGRLPSATLWTFPYNFHLREHHPRDRPIVYDWIDDLSVFPHEPALLERNHRAALAQATVVASVARTLDAEARRLRPDALYLPNAVEFDRFAREDAPPPGRSRAGPPALGRAPHRRLLRGAGPLVRLRAARRARPPPPGLELPPDRARPRRQPGRPAGARAAQRGLDGAPAVREPAAVPAPLRRGHDPLPDQPDHAQHVAVEALRVLRGGKAGGDDSHARVHGLSRGPHRRRERGSSRWPSTRRARTARTPRSASGCGRSRARTPGTRACEQVVAALARGVPARGASYTDASPP